MCTLWNSERWPLDTICFIQNQFKQQPAEDFSHGNFVLTENLQSITTTADGNEFILAINSDPEMCSKPFRELLLRLQAR